MSTKEKSITSPQAIALRLLKEIRPLIETARHQAARFVNSTLVMLNWQIGHRIRREVLKRGRADYGSRIIPKLSERSVADYGRGYTPSGLSRMIKFADEFPNGEIVATLSQQLGWSHFVEIIPVNDVLKREFYTEMCRIEKWSVRILRMKIEGMLYERTALSRKPKTVILRELKALREKDRR
jgi:hypothetical protein